MKKINNKIKKEIFYISFFFLLSFLNQLTLLFFFIYLFYKSFGGKFYCIYGLLLIAFRTIINENIAINIGSMQTIKYCIIFYLCFMICLSKKSYMTQKQAKWFKIILLICFFMFIYVLIISLIFSGYPTISIFKYFSYCFPFISIMYGIICTAKKINWLNHLYYLFTILIIGSLLSIPFPYAYYSSRNWFAGLTNQSNMFGILAAMYVAILLTKLMKEKSKFLFFNLIITICMAWMSNSRTGMLSIVLCLIIYIIYEIFLRVNIKLLALILISIFIITVTPLSNFVQSSISAFLFKGSDSTEIINSNNISNIFSSREGQKNTFLEKYEKNKIFGTGFQVPINENHRDWSLNFSTIVEPGNLLYAVIGDIGLIGFFIFTILYFTIFISKINIKKILLFIIPFAISSGEMVFFSTNNIAIILYVLFGIYLSNETEY
ncbi:O-antigen polymerase [Thomasclavelia spiroformis]|nr:O-antigen polymerase [Thomasclavelia spiroformis]